MPFSYRRTFLSVATALALAACSTGGGSGMLPGASPGLVRPAPAVDPQLTATFTVTMIAPVTAGAKSAEIDLAPAAGGSAHHFYYNLVPGKNALQIAVAAGWYLGTISSFSQALVAGKPAGAKLSGTPGIPIDVVNLGGLGVTLANTVAGVAFVPGPHSMLVEKTAASYGLSKCFTPQHASVYGTDSKGYLLVGPGAPKPALSSTDAHVAVGSPPPAAPNTFTLSAASLPVPNSTVTLHATVATIPKSISLAIGAQICGVITEYSTGITGSPKGIAVGPDGNMWFTEQQGKIGKITPAGVVTEYASGISSGAYPQLIASGPNDSLWFAECAIGKIAQITTSGVVTEYAVKTGNTAPYGVAMGSDSNVWFTESDMWSGNKIGVMTPTGTTAAEYPVASDSQPYGITAGPDHRLWFAEANKTTVGAITTSGTLTEYTTGITGDPISIAAGPDGNLWFTEGANNRVGKITTSGAVTEYTNGISQGYLPWGIAAGPDGNLWFTELEGRIGKIAPNGAVTEYTQGITGLGEFAIAAGADGSLWFTETSDTPGKIGRVQ